MKDEKLQDVYRAEKSRGAARRTIDLDALEERRAVSKVYRELVKTRNIDALYELLTQLGVKRGSERWSRSEREFWNAVREYEKPSRENP
jgi:hypothetical protein